MLNKFIVFLVLIIALGFAGENYNGYLDTVLVSDTLGAGDAFYSAAMNLSEDEDIRLLVKANDTSEAGLTDDSIAIYYGYQTGKETLGSDGEAYNAWDGEMIIDTMLASEFGAVGSGTIEASGTLTRTWGGADTTNVSGFAYQSRWFVPEWDHRIRFFVKGLAANKKGSALHLVLEVGRRLDIPTK